MAWMRTDRSPLPSWEVLARGTPSQTRMLAFRGWRTVWEHGVPSTRSVQLKGTAQGGSQAAKALMAGTVP